MLSLRSEEKRVRKSYRPVETAVNYCMIICQIVTSLCQYVERLRKSRQKNSCLFPIRLNNLQFIGQLSINRRLPTVDFDE